MGGCGEDLGEGGDSLFLSLLRSRCLSTRASIDFWVDGVAYIYVCFCIATFHCKDRLV
jgi:hypothetical protein